MSIVPQRSVLGLVLGLILFIDFVGVRESDIECTPSKFGGNINLCVAVDMLEGSDAIQRDLDMLETWVHVNLMEFKKAECEILHLGHSNSKHTYRLGREVTESCPEEKDLVVMIDEIQIKASSMHQTCSGLHPKEHGQQGEGGDSAPLLCSCGTPPGVLDTVLVSQHKEDMKLSEQVQGRAKKLLRGLEHLP